MFFPIPTISDIALSGVCALGDRLARDEKNLRVNGKSLRRPLVIAFRIVV
jgi:hypothetical protein